jgi:hypothetical protein
MPNYARIAEAFTKRPFCHGALARRGKRGTKAQEMTCAVGALVLDTGAKRRFRGKKPRAVTAKDLEDMTTDGAIGMFSQELYDTYGFTTNEEILDFVSVNDHAQSGNTAVNIPADMHNTPGKVPSSAKIKKRLMYYLHKLAEKAQGKS